MDHRSMNIHLRTFKAVKKKKVVLASRMWPHVCRMSVLVSLWCLPWTFPFLSVPKNKHTKNNSMTHVAHTWHQRPVQICSATDSQQQTVQIYMNGNKENHVLIFKNHLMLWVSQQMSHWLKTAVFKNTYFFHSKNMISWLVIESLTGPLLDVSRV